MMRNGHGVDSEYPMQQIQGKFVIAIDGPAGSGKSTIALKVAQRLGFRYIDSGAMYRAMAWQVLQRGISPQDASRVAAMVQSTVLAVYPREEGMGITVDGHDVTGEIRSEAISAATSAIATLPEVRNRLIELYRAQGRNGGAVIEGRDIGTVAFPDAELKIFLTANERVRAERRLLQQGAAVDAAGLARIENSIRQRDEQDSRRKHSPLARAADALEIDTSSLTIEEVCQTIIDLALQRAGQPKE
jgi:cytidylate kinase